MPTATTATPVVIALATYNGARFLADQLTSLQAQTWRDWTLLVRDDGSSDGTRALLADAARHDGRITIVEDGLGNLGPVGNFGRLVALALERQATRVFFADQDDVWRADKIERLLAAMDAAERQHGVSCPVLVHSDLRLIDERGQQIAPSFMAFQHIRHVDADALRTLLVQNFVTGCAMAANRALLELAVPVPPGVPMHDWWFALCAAAAGVLAFVPDVTVDYRRHGSNTVAVRGFWRTLNPLRTDWRDVWMRGVHTHQAALAQARALAERLTLPAAERRDERGDTRRATTGRARDLLDAFVAAHQQPSFARVARVRALGIGSQTWARRLALYARLWRYSPS